jgi:hypothetical protein
MASHSGGHSLHIIISTDSCMYEGWVIRSSPCTMTFNDLLSTGSYLIFLVTDIFLTEVLFIKKTGGFIIYTVATFDYIDEIKEDEMGKSCSMNLRDVHTKFW